MIITFIILYICFSMIYLAKMIETDILSATTYYEKFGIFIINIIPTMIIHLPVMIWYKMLIGFLFVTDKLNKLIK